MITAIVIVISVAIIIFIGIPVFNASEKWIEFAIEEVKKELPLLEDLPPESKKKLPVINNRNYCFECKYFRHLNVNKDKCDLLLRDVRYDNNIYLNVKHDCEHFVPNISKY